MANLLFYGIPRCREGPSEVIASVILFFSVRDSCDERKTDRVKGAHLLALLNYLINPVILIDESPVFHLAMF